MPTNDRIRIAVVSDLHYTKGCRGTCQEIFAQASNEADVLLVCGDLTDYGLPEETQVLAADLHSHARIPVIAVWGLTDWVKYVAARQLLNNDYKSFSNHQTHLLEDHFFRFIFVNHLQQNK